MAGRLIDDHSSWIGKGKDGTVFPMGCKLKEESSAEGAGSVMRYEDTTEEIKSVQDQGMRKVKAHPLKAGYRY